MQIFKSIISYILSFSQILLFNLVSLGNTRTLGVNKYMEYQRFEGFGTSSAWWSQNIDDEETARKIAKLLYDKEEGLGLSIYRFNIGAGEADNSQSRIGDKSRRTESFYYFNDKTGQWEFDFSRDSNAVRMMRLAVEYGASEIILFCNSPHYSMTVSGHASGGLEEKFNNLPEKNYDKFVDYVLTVADHFVDEGLPVKAVSPINEPQWKWGGEWVGQEGCHFDVDKCVSLLERFAVKMKERGCKYQLRAPESGQLTEDYYDYIDKFFESKILSDYCEYYAGHSYWMDNNYDAKKNTGEKIKSQYPDKKFEMSEWCELPLKIDSNTVDSGLYMANIIIQDLSLLNAVSWSSWTAVNGDGLMEFIDGNLQLYYRYYAFMHFSKFIRPGATRIDILDSVDNKDTEHIAFSDGNQTVIVLVNNSGEDVKVNLTGCSGNYETYITDSSRKCEMADKGKLHSGIVIPAKCIETVVISK